MDDEGGTVGHHVQDEDSEAGIRIRLRVVEKQNERIELKVDRLQWSIVAGAIGYLISVWTGLGGPA